MTPKELPKVGDSYQVEYGPPGGIVTEIVRLGPFYAVRAKRDGKHMVSLIHPEMDFDHATQILDWGPITMVEIGGISWATQGAFVPDEFFTWSFERQLDYDRRLLVEAGLMREYPDDS